MDCPRLPGHLLLLCPPVGLYASIRLILDDSYRVLVGAQLVRGMVQSFTADTGNGMLANPGAATKRVGCRGFGG